MLFTTEIDAIDPKTGELKNWGGPNVPGISFADAEEYCQKNGLGYCTVTGILVAEIPTDENYNPLFDKMIDYDLPENN